ncbi:MAG: cobalt-precorrin-7 (C(5))-methyltransferase [Mediterraneibacter gnavus]
MQDFTAGQKKLEEVLNGSEERYEIQRIPGISSVVYFAAALHTSWEDAALVSLHGRWQNWIYEAEHHAKTFLLLGGRKENLKEKLLYYGLEDLTVHIGKNFSYPQEQIFFKNGKRTDGGGYRGALHCLSGKSTSITEGVPAFEG